MRIIFLTTFLIFVFGSCYSKPMTSEDFVYTKVYICGPKKWSIFYIPHIELIYYHFIHFDQFGNVVILNDGDQFKSFEKTVQSDLHQKPGGELNLTFRKNDRDYLFDLKRKGFDGKSSVRTIVFNETKLTYQDRQTKLNKSGETESTKVFNPGLSSKVR